MSWDYRIVKKQPTPTETSFEIIEVYYNEKDEIKSWSADSAVLHGETLDDLKWCLDRVSDALEQPILTFVNDKLEEMKDEE